MYKHKTDNEILNSLSNWKTIIKKYQNPCSRKAVIQIINTFLPFLGLWVLMYFSLNWSFWITFVLALVNGFFLARIFIIQHDCGHQSFTKSKKLNDIIGFICSFFSSIPYRYWARVHSFHHGHNGMLEDREVGNIPFLTVEEYKNLNKFGKIKYRFFRHPVILFLIAPIAYVLISNRYPFFNFEGWKKVRWSQTYHNLWIVLFYVLLILLLGWKAVVLIHLPIVIVFSVIAFWFFFVQHQHEETYHQKQENWNYLLAAIRGSSYYKLPKVFQWLTGNIGFHHIHHLSSRIPNYHLEICAKENPILTKYVTVLSFRKSLKCIFHSLYDEKTESMVSFRKYKTLQAVRV